MPGDSIDRIEDLRQVMEKEKTDLLVLRLSENILFVSGYFPMNGFSTLVLSGEADPVLIIPEGEIEKIKIANEITVFGTRTAKAGLPFSISKKRKIEEGDLVLLEMGVSVDGYWSDISRTVVAGSKNDI